VRAGCHRRKTSLPEIAIVVRYRIVVQAKIVVPVMVSLAYHGARLGVKEAPRLSTVAPVCMGYSRSHWFQTKTGR
jgi:hypothetical protein